MDKAYEILFLSALIALSLGMILALIRVIRGPRIADRIMGVNMIGTMAICALAILSRVEGHGYLLDVALIYCMISFLAVVVLSKVFINVFENRRQGRKGDEQ